MQTPLVCKTPIDASLAQGCIRVDREFLFDYVLALRSRLALVEARGAVHVMYLIGEARQA